MTVTVLVMTQPPSPSYYYYYYYYYDNRIHACIDSEVRINKQSANKAITNIIMTTIFSLLIKNL